MTYATCMYIYIYKLGTRHVVTRRLEPLTESSETIPWSSPDLRILYSVVLTFKISCLYELVGFNVWFVKRGIC